MRKYRFVTAYEPAFPDIKKVLLSHQNIIYEDEELREFSQMEPEISKSVKEEKQKTSKNS